MFVRDLKSNLDVVVTLAPQATVASRTGAAVDLQGYDGCVALVSLGTWVDGTHTPKLQESTDNTTFTDVAASNLQGTFTLASASAAPAVATQRVGYIGGQRYVRGFITVAGATTGIPAAINIIRSEANRQPLA